MDLAVHPHRVLTGYRNRLRALLTWWLAFTRDVRRKRTFTTQQIAVNGVRERPKLPPAQPRWGRRGIPPPEVIDHSSSVLERVSPTLARALGRDGTALRDGQLRVGAGIPGEGQPPERCELNHSASALAVPWDSCLAPDSDRLEPRDGCSPKSGGVVRSAV